jgi:hypothetical protein
MELLNLVGQEDVPDQAEGEEAPGTLPTQQMNWHPALEVWFMCARTTFMKQLYGQKKIIL